MFDHPSLSLTKFLYAQVDILKILGIMLAFFLVISFVFTIKYFIIFMGNLWHGKPIGKACVIWIWCVIISIGGFSIVTNYPENLGFKVVCNAQQQRNTEQCENAD